MAWALAGDNDYPLGDAMDDLAEEAETAFKRLGGNDQKEHGRRH